MTVIFLKYASTLLISLAVIYFAGHSLSVLFRFHHGLPWTALFIRMITGLVFTVMLISLLYTRFETVNLIFLIIGIPLLLDHLRSVKKRMGTGFLNFHLHATVLLSLLACSLVLFCCRFYLIYDPSGIPVVPNNDTLFHANLSNYLRLTGNENVSLDFPGLSSHPHDPYHYFDIWLNAGLTAISGLNALPLYILVTVTTGLVITFTGLMAIAEKLSKASVATGLLCFFFLFFTGLILPYTGSLALFENANVFTVSPFVYNKLIVVFIFLEAAVLLFLNEKKIYGAAALAVLPAIFVSTSVSILPALVVFFMKEFYDEKNIKALVKELGIVLAVFLFLFLFYSTGEADQSLKIGNTGGVQKLLNFGYLKTCINIAGLTTIQMVLLYFPVIVIVAVSFSYLKRFFRFSNNYLLLAVLIFLFSLGAWAILHYMNDTVQLFSNISIMMINLVSICMILYLWERADGLQWITTAGLTFLIIAGNVTSAYINLKHGHTQDTAYLKATVESVQGRSQAGAFMLSHAAYHNVFARNPIFNIAAGHLAYYNSNAYTYSISVYDAPLSADRPETDRHLMQLAAFYRFTENQKKDGTFRSIPQSQLDFIDTFKIDYLVISKDAVPDSILVARFDKVMEDPLSGEKFVLLKH